MNWTGGRLSRHSRNANGSLTQRQKQHFAKARGNLLNGSQKRSPMRWSIFDRDYGPARPEGTKLYTTPHPARDIRAELGPINEGMSKKIRPDTCPKPAFIQATSLDNNKSGQEWESYRELLVQLESDHGLHQATLPSFDTETGKHQAPVMKIAGDVNADDEASSLKERRRRILRRIDWVGANIQHPIKLKFTATGNDERMGKRRRITARHQNQFCAVAQPITTSSLPMAKPKQKPQGSLDAQSTSIKNIEALPKNHVRISIGGMHVAAGVASSTSHSKTVGGRFPSSQASMSDGMLLDGDDISRQHRQLPQERQMHLSYPASPPLALSNVVGKVSSFSASPRDLPIHAPHRKQILSSYGRSNWAVDRHTAASCVDPKPRFPTSCVGNDNSILDFAQHLDQHVNHLVNPSDQQARLAIQSHSNLVTLRSRGVQNLPDSTSHMYADVSQISDPGTNPESFPPDASYAIGVSGQLSESARRLQSVARYKSRRNTRLDPQPELLHPIPLTSRTSRVLHCTSSEAGSNVAQVHMQPVATQSQMLDEEIWKTWVLSSWGGLSNESENGVYDDVSISPGISNYEHRSIQVNPRNAIGRDKNDLKMLQRFKHHDSGSKQEMEVTGESPTDIVKEENHKESFPRLKEHVSYEDSLLTSPVVDYKSLFLSRAKKPPSPPKPTLVRVAANPDEVWKKFILSDSEKNDEGDNLPPLASHQELPPAPIQRRPPSSIVAHYSAETASNSHSELTMSSITEPNTTLNNVNFSTTISLIEGPQITNHTTQGSNPSSLDGLSHQPSSVDQIRTEHVSSFSTPPRPIRKLTFTKPPRFQVSNRGSSPETTAATAGSPVHIGKAFSIAKLRDGGGVVRRERQQEKHIYRFENEDVESIEDD